jgi:hypothetical protein
MLATYNILKPPQFGNCSVLDPDMKKSQLTFEKFKAIFNEEAGSNQLEKIREKINLLIEKTDTDRENAEFDNNMSFYSYDQETVHCIIYYLTGFICKKIYKNSNCETCRKNLYSTCQQEETNFSALTNIKSRGGLNHPPLTIFNLFLKIECIFKKHVLSVDAFDQTIDEIFSKNIVLEFSCQMHQQEIMSKLIYYFLVMRIKQYYKTDFKNTKKLS